MKYRVMSACVTVSGPPWASWSVQIGISEHADPSTLPNRTMQNRVALVRPRWRTYISARRLVAPITDDGFTALSVEIITNRSHPAASAASAMLRVP